MPENKCILVANEDEIGDAEQKAQQSIKDNELLAQFKEVEEMDSKDKSTIKDIIDAFIKRSKLKHIAAL